MMNAKEIELIAESLFLMASDIAEEIAVNEDEKWRIAEKLHRNLYRLMNEREKRVNEEKQKEKREADEAQEQYEQHKLEERKKEVKKIRICSIGDLRKEKAIEKYESQTGRKVVTIDDHLNINCENCQNCFNCWDCEYCSYCDECRDCKECDHCVRCYDCVDCYFCEFCRCLNQKRHSEVENG